MKLKKRIEKVMLTVRYLIEDERIFERVEKKGNDKKRIEDEETITIDNLEINKKINYTDEEIVKSNQSNKKEEIKNSNNLKNTVEKKALPKSLIFPSGYKKTKKKLETAELQNGTQNFEYINEGTNSLVAYGIINSDFAFDFDNTEGLIKKLHAEMGKNDGIIEVKNGFTTGKRKYIYYILKHRIINGGNMGGCFYSLKMNIQEDNLAHLLVGEFRQNDTGGQREIIYYSILKNEGKNENKEEEWNRDPYDPDFKQGFLMNQAELESVDEMFPNHPLSELRKFILNIISIN